ncbi:hypothetical protein AUF78_18325 [archaeon 13_1_20CM_2_51_12]|nr:MAG: hypothetical protein AUF78_18325 [archaeon 13_1_20CM_2_51_12]
MQLVMRTLKRLWKWWAARGDCPLKMSRQCWLRFGLNMVEMMSIGVLEAGSLRVFLFSGRTFKN